MTLASAVVLLFWVIACTVTVVFLIERLMGMILVPIAIQMFMTGAETYFARGA